MKLTVYLICIGIWRQGDFIALNPTTKGLMILGRSDGVLNPSGVRFGSAEIYAVLESPPPPFDFSKQIEDSLCVGQRRPGDSDERVLLFLKMKEGYRLSERLKKDVRDAIQKSLSKRHVPAFIFNVHDIPVSQVSLFFFSVTSLTLLSTLSTARRLKLP
jgi:acetoacetyl-CoA synthetase